MARFKVDYDNPEWLVDSVWPFDGPHSADSVEAAAVALGRLVRYLNNATGYSRSLPYAATAYRVTSNLASMAGLLPQLLDQLAQFMEQQAGDPSLYDDRRNGNYPAHRTALAVSAALGEARRAAGSMGAVMERAASAASHLGNDEV
jgi:hypothetical protein